MERRLPNTAASPRDAATWRHQFQAKVYRYRALLGKYWWILLFTTAAGLAIGAWHSARQQVVYVSRGRIMVSGKVNIPEGASYLEEMSAFLYTQEELMKDGKNQERAELQVRTQYPEAPVTPVTLTVHIVPNSMFFDLEASGGEPEYPPKFLEAIMKSYMETRHEERTEKSETAEDAIGGEITKGRNALAQEEDKLLAFQKEHNVGFLQEEGNSAAQYLSKLNTQLADLKKEADLLDLFQVDQQVARSQEHSRTQTATSGQSAGDIRAGQTAGPELEYVRAKQQIELLKAERDDYAKDLRPKHPIMIEYDRAIAKQQELIDSFRKQSAEDLQHRREETRLEIENLEKTIKQTEAKALVLSQQLAEYNSIEASINRERGQLEKLSDTKGNVEVSRNVDQDIVSIRQDATPAVPEKPGATTAIAIAVGFGFALGVIILIFIDQFDDRAASFSEFQAHFPDRVLAQIPSSPPPRGKDVVAALAANDDRHAFAESFRSLRSSLIFLPVSGAAPKFLLITSAAPNEGKSTVAVNLAITLALSGLDILLVDGDLRRGEIHRTFSLPNERGLSDVLTGAAPLDSTIQATSVPRLSLLSRGTIVPNPGELYLSKETDLFIKTVYSSYDYVIMDSSPVMAADDSTSLAPKADATIFIFRFTSSHIRMSRKALDLLAERQANIIGVVCNDVSEAMQEYYYYRYPEYYAAGSKQKSRSRA